MRRALLRVAVLAVSALLSLAVVEAVVRSTLGPVPRGNVTFIPGSIRVQARFPGARFELRRNAEAKQSFPDDPRGYFDEDGTLTYRTNALGFRTSTRTSERGVEPTVSKPPGTIRILGFGDSFTFGTGVRFEDTFLSVLERELRERVPRAPIEVWNLGVMAYSTTEEVSLLEHVGLGFEPDLVVLCLFLNDAGGGAAYEAFEARHKDWELPAWRRFSWTADRLLHSFESRGSIEALARAYDESFSDRSPGWRDSRAALHRAHGLSEERGFPFVLVMFPVLFDLSDGYPFGRPHAVVARFARELGLPFLDLRGAFQGHDGPELWVHPTNQHPNEVAHAIAGRALADFLIDQSLVPGAPD